MGISLRLQEERKRLGLTQEAAAARLDATKRSVINWEGGAALPGAEVLARYAELGANVLYILTGQRDSSQPQIASEQVLIDSYRRCSVQAQRNLLQTATLLAGRADSNEQQSTSQASTYSSSGSNMPVPDVDSPNAAKARQVRKRATKTDK
ncbi:helix-turn-helix domain-containing protein [Lampropedia aestuarii]|uniref:helix-turn-helix domain-containing protein n=1 Tax=Lampropedia aestuarii TaxID=2562762 RepID=UPI003CC83687